MASGVGRELRRDKRNKVITYTLVLILVGLFLLLLMLLLTNSKFDSSKDERFHKLDIYGEYSLDGLEWVEFNSLVNLPTEFEKITIIGHFAENLAFNDDIVVPSYGQRLKMYFNGEEIINFGEEGSYRFSHGPGYGMWYQSVQSISNHPITINDTVILSVENVYYKTNPSMGYEYLNKIAYGKNIVFFRIFRSNAMDEVVSLLIIGTGVLAFIFAFIMYNDYKRRLYAGFAFSHFAVTAGLYCLLKSSFEYMPLIVRNPTLCSYLDTFSIYLMIISFSLYVLFNLIGRNNVRIMYFFVWMTILVAIVAFSIQFTGYRDLYEMQFLIMIPGFLGIIIGAVCLVLDSMYYKNTHCMLLLLILAPYIFALCMTQISPDNANVFMRYGIFASAVLHMVEMVRFYREERGKNAERQQVEQELIDNRVLIMQSQIQPHFLYNSLSTIQILCEKNPSLAADAISHFSKYLRMNMDSIKNQECVPFERELEHLNNYLFIEKLRFRNLLEVEYDIKVRNFMCPPLTVQPIVENAVKHGVGKKEAGGTVKISTKENHKNTYIIIEDDGVGFDTNKSVKEDGKSHVGLDNVSQRLYELCNGELSIASEPGKGTRIEIRIPKETRYERNYS